MAASLVIARLLDPEAFGAFGVIQTAGALAGAAADLGLFQALVRQTDRPSSGQAGAALGSQLAGGTAFSLLVLAASPLLVLHTSVPAHAIPALAAFLAGQLTVVLTRTALLRLERSLDFAAVARVEAAQAMLGTVVTLALALAGARLWALVGGALAGYASGLLLLWRRRERGVLPRFDPKAVRPLLAFGLPLQAVGLLAYGRDYVATLAGPFVLDVATVGFLVWAFNVSLFLSVFSLSAARVAFPFFAQALGDPAALSRAVASALRFTAAAGTPLVLGAALFAQPIVVHLYHPKWLPALPALRLYLAGVVLGLVTAPVMSLMASRGETKLALKVTAASAALTWIATALLWPHLGWLAIPAGTLLPQPLVLAWLARYCRRACGVAPLAEVAWPILLPAACLLPFAFLLPRVSSPAAQLSLLAAYCLCAYATTPLTVRKQLKQLWGD